MMPNGYSVQYIFDQNGNITFRKDVCDGEISIGSFKTCLKEFNATSAIGLVIVIVGVILVKIWKSK